MTGLEAKRQAEKAKYEAIYGGKCQGEVYEHYGSYNHWRKLWPVLRNTPIESLCDVGTGTGDLPRWMFEKANVKHAVGIDFALQTGVRIDNGDGRVMELIRAPAHDIPLPDKSVEWVTAFDVLEHLLPEEVEDVLAEFKRVAQRGFVFSICHTPSKITVGGSNLHPTIESETWWREKIEATGAVIEKVNNKYLWCRFPWAMPKQIEELIESDAPDTVVILGKGPSLEKYEDGMFGDALVMGINECGETYDCDYCLYIDNPQVNLDLENVTPIRPVKHCDAHGGRGFIYQRKHGYLGPLKLHKATAALAVTICAKWGVKDLILVGFDSWDGPTEQVYANSLSRVISERGNGDYTIENGHIAEALKMFKGSVRWFHREVANG